MKKIIFCSIAFLCFCSAYATERNREEAFYAVASLKFHLEKKLSNQVSDYQIIFEEEDIVRLWEKAYSCSHTTALIDKAYSYYYQALDNIDNQSQLFEESKAQLSQAYRALGKDRKKQTLPKSSNVVHKAIITNYPHFDDNAHFDETTKRRIRPHLLPLKHPAKIFLDEIFEKQNAIQNLDVFTKMGFKKIAKHSSLCVVADHPDLKKYVFKVYLFTDQETKYQIPGWEALTKRCEVAAKIRNLIKEKKIRHFKVPNKWLYVLPQHIYTPLKSGEHAQPVLLVAKKMPLVSQKGSFKAWKNETTHRHLDELFCILSHGYGSTKLDINVPYTTKNKFAFIDTEADERIHSYEKVKRYLNPKMQSYWDELVRKGGNP